MSDSFIKDGRKYDRVTSVIAVYQDVNIVDWKVSVEKSCAFAKGFNKAVKEFGTISAEEMVIPPSTAKIKKEATTIGTHVDEYVKADILGQPLPKLKKHEEKNCVSAYHRWQEDHGRLMDLSVGKRMYDDDLLVCGEPDIMDLDSRRVIDIKCSKKVSDTYFIQVAVYAHMLGMHKGAILRLDKALGDYEYVEFDVGDEQMNVFISLLNVYRYFKKEG